MQVPKGPKTIATLRGNVSVGVQYLEAWLGGLGCVPLDNLMEDAATAEICRTQVSSTKQTKKTVRSALMLALDPFRIHRKGLPAF